MPEGIVRTIFQGDPEGILAAHAKMRAAQKETEEGNQRIGKSAKQMGYDYDAALGNVNKGLLELGHRQKEAFLGIEFGARHAANSIKAAFSDLNVALGGIAKPDGWGALSGMGRGQLDLVRERDKWTELGRAGATTLKMLEGGQVNHNAAIRQSNSLMESLAKNTLTTVTAYVGMQEAIQIVNQMLQRQNTLQQQALDAAKQLAETQAKGAINLGGTGQQAVAWDAEIKALGLEMGVGITDMGGLSQKALSASGGTGNEAAALRRLRKGIQVGVLTPGDMEEFVSGLGALESAMPGATTDEAAELLVGAGAKSKVDTQARVGEYFGKGITAQVLASNKSKVKPQVAGVNAAGLIALYSQKLNDAEGRISSKGATLFATDMRDFFAKHPELPDPGETEARWKFIQSHPELVEEAVGGLTGEAEGKLISESLLRGDQDITKDYESAKTGLGLKGGKADELVKHLEGGTPQIKLARALRKIKAAQEWNASDDVRGATIKAAEEAYSTGREEMERQQGYIASLSNLMNRKEGRKVYSTDDAYLENMQEELETTAKFVRDPAKAKKLTDQAEIIEGLRADLKANTEAVKRNNELMEQNNAMAASGQGGGYAMDAWNSVGGITETQQRRANSP